MLNTVIIIICKYITMCTSQEFSLNVKSAFIEEFTIKNSVMSFTNLKLQEQ